MPALVPEVMLPGMAAKGVAMGADGAVLATGCEAGLFPDAVAAAGVSDATGAGGAELFDFSANHTPMATAMTATSTNAFFMT